MTGETVGGVRKVLRVEGLCALIAALLAYSSFGAGWGTFALFFLTPDLSFLGSAQDSSGRPILALTARWATGSSTHPDLPKLTSVASDVSRAARQPRRDLRR
jgi:hypothetical protein